MCSRNLGWKIVTFELILQTQGGAFEIWANPRIILSTTYPIVPPRSLTCNFKRMLFNSLGKVFIVDLHEYKYVGTRRVVAMISKMCEKVQPLPPLPKMRES